MIEFSTTNILLAFLGTLVLLALLILAVLIRNNSRLRDITFPIYDYVVKEAESEAGDIVSVAHNKAKEIIETAEKRAHNIQERAENEAKVRIEKEKKESEELNTSYENRLKELAAKNEELLKVHEDRLNTQYTDLERAVAEKVKKGDVVIEEASQLLVKRIEESQKDLHERLSKEITGQLTGAFDEVERAIDAYRVNRLRLIDDQIISLVEQTAAIVLRKELPLRDQSEFIYRALDEVKQKGLFS